MWFLSVLWEYKSVNSAKSAASLILQKYLWRRNQYIVDIDCGGIVFFQKKQKPDCYKMEGVSIKKKKKKKNLPSDARQWLLYPQKVKALFFVSERSLDKI